MKLINRILYPKISRDKLIGNTLEISLPLSSLLGLKLQEESYQRLMNLIYDAIEIENPMKGLKASQEEKTCLETLLSIEDIPKIIKIENIEEKTPDEI